MIIVNPVTYDGIKAQADSSGINYIEFIDRSARYCLLIQGAIIISDGS